MEEKKEEEVVLSVCGAECSKCKNYKDCGGCGAKNGKPFYLKGEICEVYECALRKRIKSCGGCDAANCSIFKAQRMPGMSDDDFNQYILQKAYNMKEEARKKRAGIGIRLGNYSVIDKK